MFYVVVFNNTVLLCFYAFCFELFILYAIRTSDTLKPSRSHIQSCSSIKVQCLEIEDKRTVLVVGGVRNKKINKRFTRIGA